jgi:hypothetical protein
MPGKEYAMNTSATDNVVVEFVDEDKPAEILTGWAGRTPDVD